MATAVVQASHRQLALVAVKDIECGFNSHWWQPVAPKIDLAAARHAVWDFRNGWEAALERQLQAMLGANHPTYRLLEAARPDYATLRNYLAYELDFEYRVACQAALEASRSILRVS